MCNLHYHVYQNTIFIPEVSTAMALPAGQEPGQVLLPPQLGVEGPLYSTPVQHTCTHTPVHIHLYSTPVHCTVVLGVEVEGHLVALVVAAARHDHPGLQLYGAGPATQYCWQRGFSKALVGAFSGHCETSRRFVNSSNRQAETVITELNKTLVAWY